MKIEYEHPLRHVLAAAITNHDSGTAMAVCKLGMYAHLIIEATEAGDIESRDKFLEKIDAVFGGDE